MASDRLLLCRPHGGLNDMLCEIEHACRYGERFGRHVIVDTESPTTSFRDRFANYFVCLDGGISFDARAFADSFDRLDVNPHAARGRVDAFTACFDIRRGDYVDPDTGTLLRFDPARDYPEPLLIHSAKGGGTKSMAALRRMRLHDAIVDELLERLRRIPGPYTAIHVRDTDYRTPYRDAISELAPRVAGPVFIATDNRDVVQFCRAVFGEKRTFSFAALSEETGKPLHKGARIGDVRARNRDTILDLMMLSLSREYFFFELSENMSGARHSGFSILARLLKDSPQTLGQLIGRSDPVIDPQLWPRTSRATTLGTRLGRLWPWARPQH